MKKITLLIMFFVSTLCVKAQVVAYQFSQSTGTYTEITGGTVLGNETSDDQRFVDPAIPLGGTVVTGVGFPIGFNFVFNGVVYDRFAVNNNGWISLGMSSLGATAVNMNTSNAYTPLSTTVTTVSDDLVARISPLGRDLGCQVGSTLRFELLGTSPNQVLVVQWKNYEKYVATGDSFDFQIRLHETTNVVEVVYGTFVSNTTSGVFDCGLRAAPAASAINFNSRTSATSWTVSTPSVTAADKMTIVDTNFPPSGLTFTWTPPTCPSSTGLTTSALTNNSATVTWPIPNPAPASGYEYVVSTSSVAPVTNGTSTGDNFVSVSSLSGNTVYYVYVRSNCGSGFGVWFLNGSFRTLCDSVTDFVQTFENYPTGTAFLPDCWSKGASTGNVYNTTGSVAPMSPANRLYMNISTTTSAYAILPAVSNLQADTHRLKFKAYATAASKILNVGYLTNPADVNSFVLLDIYNMPSTAATTAQEFTLIPSAIPVGVTNLAFKLEPGTATTIYIDDVKWEVNSTCIEPSALTINSLTNNSVNLAWTNGGSETQWEAQYGPTNFTLGTGTLVSNITTNPYNLTGLTANTTYQFYVRAVCSGPINSSWAGPFSFKTQCDDNTFVTENFDGLTVSGTTTMPDCWRVAGNGTAYTTTGAVAPFSPLNRLYMFASSTAVPATRSYVILPALSNLQANTHRLKFRAFTTAVGRTVDVGYLTDPSNISSFVSIQVVTLPSTVIANAQDFVVTPVAGSIPAGVKNLVFQNPGFAGGTSAIYIDNVIWEPQPTTPPDCATGIVATPNATCGNFANTITWSATTGADGYNLTIGTTPGGTDVLNNSNLGIVTTYTFVGNFNTTYYYTVVPYNVIGAATGCTELSFTTAATGCYCTPVYTTGKTSGDLIANVVITDTTLSNNSGATPVNPAYTYFTGQPNYTASLTTGTNYSVSVTVGTFGGQNVAVWVDYNDNLTFETTERVGFTTTSIAGNGTGTFSIVLACNAPVGVHRMRVRDVWNTTGNLIDPCASYGYGETEDYDITIVAANVPAPTGDAAQSFCDTPTPTVASLVATGTAIQWYATETGGTALLSTQALISGTTYYASQTPTCESLTRLAVTATINAITTTTFEPVAAVCAGATAPVLPLTSTNAITGTWSPETVSTVTAGTTTYTFTPTAGQCATTATLDIVVNALPAAPTANSAQTFCPTTNPTLASLAVTGTGLVWYDAPTGGNVLSSTTVLTATTYYVASNDGTCDSDRVAISTTSFCPPEVCLTATFGQYPSATFVPNSANCDGFTSQTITTCGYASEYSVVTVTLGQTYVFASSIATDIITISADGGATSVTSGVGSLSWVATISGDVRFYTHLTGCASQTTCRTKTVTCGIISTDLPDYVNLQFPSTLTFAQGGSGTVYGQVYEGGLTDVAPNVTGQAPGITAWVGISPAGSNTNPNTWTNWVPATWNSGHVSNNDEYQATIGATLLPGTYYYATRFRLNSGAYVYGGIDSSNNGNFWDGTTFNSGVLTVTPPPAPANDDCSGAYTVTVNTDLNCTSVTAGSLIGATASTTDATACFGTEDDDVWFSFVATATTHQVSMVNITGGTTDLYHSLWTGADCSSLTLVPNTCSDPNVSAPSGLTIGQTYYIRVYSWTDTAGQTSTFSVCVGTLPPPPANDNCSGAIALTAGGVFADFAVTGTNASSTNSNPPAPDCASFNGGDVWYSVTIPASGNLTIETGTGSIADTGMAVYSGTCSALNLVECDDDDSSNGNYSLISLVGRTPGEILYVNVWDYFNDQIGTFQVSAYDASLGNTSFDSANFSYYPNPVKNMLNLAYTQNISSVAVFNLLGQEVVTKVVNSNQSQIDMSHLPTGTYLVKVTADNQVKTIKVIKE